VDAVTSGATPGTLPRVGHEQLLQEPQHHASAHTLSLPESLRWLELACPELASVRYELWGIEVATASCGEGLSPAVAAGVERLLAEMLRSLASR